MILFALPLLALASPSFSRPCNGTGVSYFDSPACECDATFAATSNGGCSPFANASAPLQLAGGNPLLLAEWWTNSTFNSESLDAWLTYRPGYGAAPSLLSQVERAIRSLHLREGNVDSTLAKEYHLVFGAGSTNVLTALLFGAASMVLEPAGLFVPAPHWFHYSHLASMSLPFGLHWQPDAHRANIFVNTWPNNPDGSLYPLTGGTKVPPRFSFVDCAYNWRSWGRQRLLAADGVDAALFTLSKLTGHAGTRFGWALVRDRALADAANAWLRALQLQPASNLALGQALQLLTPLADGSARLLDDVRSVMQERGAALAAAEAACASPRATNEAAPGFFYAWFRCTRPADAVDCAAALQQAVGIVGHFGQDFGATNASVRIPLVQRTPVWTQSTLPRLAAFLCDTP